MLTRQFKIIYLKAICTQSNLHPKHSHENQTVKTDSKSNLHPNQLAVKVYTQSTSYAGETNHTYTQSNLHLKQLTCKPDSQSIYLKPICTQRNLWVQALRKLTILTPKATCIQSNFHPKQLTKQLTPKATCTQSNSQALNAPRTQRNQPYLQTQSI